MSELFQFGKQVLASQPFSALLGTELEAFEPGKAVLLLQFIAHSQCQHGFVHGGVVSYLADNALTYAGGSGFNQAYESRWLLGVRLR